MITKYIVTTTINPPTKAIELFDSMIDWKLIVIGDLKTPKNYNLKNGMYISPNEQENYNKKLSDAIGWNCIQRRNFGIMMAYDMGAEIIATIDDDNIPYKNWGLDLLINKNVTLKSYETTQIAFDPIFPTNHGHLWHRGFPIQLLSKRDKQEKIVTKKIDVQADFWNGDPDIDAICRMEHSPECKFDEKYFPFSTPCFSPFNSQNTFLSREVIPNYFLFPHIGRMDDIWASYYVEAKGFSVAYSKASVYQERNVHDLTVDMIKEFIGYEHNVELLEQLKKSPDNIFKFLPEKSKLAFEIFKEHFI